MAKQVDEMKHSPTPWRGNISLLDAEGNIIGWVRAKHDHLFILHCVNTHDKLVESCQYSKTLLESGVGQATHALALLEATLAEEQKCMQHAKRYEVKS